MLCKYPSINLLIKKLTVKFESKCMDLKNNDTEWGNSSTEWVGMYGNGSLICGYLLLDQW